MCDVEMKFFVNSREVDIEDVPAEYLRGFFEGIKSEISRRLREDLLKRGEITRCINALTR